MHDSGFIPQFTFLLSIYFLKRRLSSQLDLRACFRTLAFLKTDWTPWNKFFFNTSFSSTEFYYFWKTSRNIVAIIMTHQNRELIIWSPCPRAPSGTDVAHKIRFIFFPQIFSSSIVSVHLNKRVFAIFCIRLCYRATFSFSPFMRQKLLHLFCFVFIKHFLISLILSTHRSAIL